MINTIFNSDCIEGLKSLPDESVNCCVTSPPYFGLRDYGHDGQIGLEETPEAFVAKMVEVFTEVRRVLKNDGTLWLNLGDSYASQPTGSRKPSDKQSTSLGDCFIRQDKTRFKGIKQKDILGIPWMTAFALRSSGWYLRQDIIWAKPNPMPESVTDRCTKSHEYIFLLSKSAKYYYDHGAIKEEAVTPMDSKAKCAFVAVKGKCNDVVKAHTNNVGKSWDKTEDRNKRSVWTVTTKPFSDAHFATFPEDLIVDCIKAGCPENGLVLDPFMGAGTTALVAAKLGRNYVGFELNKDYIRIADKRLRNELGMFYPKAS